MTLRRPSILPRCLLVPHAKSCFTTWLLPQAKQTNPLFLLFMISYNFHAFSATFSKTRSSPFETAFCAKTTVSSHFLAPHFSHLHQFLNNLLKRLSFTVPKTSLLNPIPTKLLYKTVEVLLPTITNILNKSLTLADQALFPLNSKQQS